MPTPKAMPLLAHLQRNSEYHYGLTFEDDYEMDMGWKLEAACRAADFGDVEAVREWLAGADVDVSTVNNRKAAVPGGSTVLHRCADIKIYDLDSETCVIARLKVEIARLLIDAGADVDLDTMTSGSPLMTAMLSCRSRWEGEVGSVVHFLDLAALLVGAGASVNTHDEPNEYSGDYSTPLGCALSCTDFSDTPHGIEIVALLLRAGASLDDCGGNVYTEEVYSAEYQVTRREQSWQEPDGVMHPAGEPWHECKALLAGLRAAGSWKAFERAPRKTLIVLRCLHSKGRATTADPIMKFLCELGDNGVVWNVLSYWSARLY